MGIRVQTVNSHWSFFLALEHDLEQLSRYIEFSQSNFACFSLEIARVLLAAGAEVDVVCKQLCKKLNPRSRAASIGTYRTELTTGISVLSSWEVQVPRFGLVLHPWDEWKNPDGIPFWWTAYNKTKHHRHTDFKSANLKNAINAVAGLFVVILYLYREQAEEALLLPAAQLFRPEPDHFDGATFHEHEFGINYVF